MDQIIHTVVLTQDSDGLGPVEALWLSNHQSSGAEARADDPIAALRALADQLDRIEDYRASLPD